MPEAEENDYEAQRAARIAANKARMAELGLVEASHALLTSVRGPGVTLEAGTEAQPRKKRRVQEVSRRCAEPAASCPRPTQSCVNPTHPPPPRPPPPVRTARGAGEP